MSFIAELKQRKVFRVATVYLVVAWVAIQAASIALPAFDAPAWVLRVLILLFALGLPLALLLAWALELTPEGIKVEAGGVGSKRIVAICAGLVALALAWYYVGQPALRKAESASSVATAPAAPVRSIAVLPFVNMSGDPKNDYFSDGLAETTLDMLAQVPNLKVIARTSSFAFKGKAQDMRQIGKALGAANLLEGSVQEAGDTVRITVQLIRAADGSHLWSHHYDRPMTDVFKIQDEVATAVVQALQGALPQAEQQRLVQKRTDNVAAYQEYLKGIALLPGRKVPEMREAAQHFERAIELDPNYARAYVGAHDAYYLLDQYATISMEERAREERYLDRARALAPELGEAHIAHAVALQNAGNFPAAELEYRRGVQLAPGYATGYQWYGEFLNEFLGRFDEGLPLLEKAVALDPLSPVVRDVRILDLGYSGRVDEALALSNQEIAAHPEIAMQYNARAVLNEQRGDLVAALRDLRTAATLDPAAVGLSAIRCQMLIDVGALVEARACTASFAQQATPSNYLLNAETRLAFIAGDTKGALALFAQIQPVSENVHVYYLLADGRPAETLAIDRKLVPGFFAQQTPQVYPGQAQQAIIAGIALLKTGATAQGQALLRTAAAAIVQLPYAAGRQWFEAYAYAYLGEKDRAIKALQDAVNAGYFLTLPELDADPLLADLRADPRYAKILAPARAKAAVQIEAARKAGLL